MRKLLPLAMLVSTVCGDTYNTYSTGDGDSKSQGNSCETAFQHIIDCDGLKHWSESKKENFYYLQ